MLGRICPVVTSSRTTAGILQVFPSISIQTCEVHHHKERHDLQRFLGIHRSNKAKANRNTHVNEKMFRRMRGRKIPTIDLPDDAEQRELDALPPTEVRLALLKKGINPYKDVQPRNWQESQVTMQSFNAVVDPYVSPEDPLPFLGSNLGENTRLKAEEVKERVLHKYHNWRNGTSRIKKKEGFEKFDPTKFGPTADHIYEEAHKALMSRDTKTLHKFITERAYVKMWPDVSNGSIFWELVERVEPSKVVAVRCADNPYKSGNDIAQLTVRMHTKQKLAIYDRFGHLILGSETEPRDVVEYVVFENHIAVVDGVWRLHDKVYPKWSQPKQGAHLTKELEDSTDTNEVRPQEASSLPLRAEQVARQRKQDEKSGKSEDD
ncbi:unnamed protein product [Auanema sp. JU1783]|nr:unnamed protein product [Auanema sp. JU1783]